MRSVDYINENRTEDYSNTQKTVVGAVASFVFAITSCVMVLLYLEVV